MGTKCREPVLAYTEGVVQLGKVVAMRWAADASDEEEWLRAEGIADRYKVSQATVRRWANLEGMPSEKIRRARLFHVPSCDVWVRRQTLPVGSRKRPAPDPTPAPPQDTPTPDRPAERPKLQLAETPAETVPSPASAALHAELIRELNDVGTRLTELAGRALEREGASGDPRPGPDS